MLESYWNRNLNGEAGIVLTCGWPFKTKQSTAAMTHFVSSGCTDIDALEVRQSKTLHKPTGLMSLSNITHVLAARRLRIE